MIKLSIITVNLNNANGLCKTIKSVIQQNYLSIEHIIVDGKSTDNSVNIIKKHVKDYSKTKGGLHWISEPDSGIYNAMNKGINIAQGTYCYFLNSGDTLVNSNVFSKIFAKDHSEDIIYGKILNNNNIIEYPQKIDLAFFIGRTLTHQAVLIKRSQLIKFGKYDEKLRFVSDWKFFLVLFMNASSCTFYKTKIIIVDYDNTGLTSQKSNMPKLNAEKERVIEELFPTLYLNFKDIKKRTPLTTPNILKLLSEFVKYDKKTKDYNINQCNEVLLLNRQIDYLSEQYTNEIKEITILNSIIKNSRSYKIGNFVLRPLSSLKSTLKKKDH